MRITASKLRENVYRILGEAIETGIPECGCAAGDRPGGTADFGRVALELQLLHEIGRLRFPASKRMALLSQDIGLRVCNLPFPVVVDHALAETWSRDPFDRLIVANAKANGSVLITRDEKIRKHYGRAVW